MILRADGPLAVNISRVDFLLRIVLHRFAHLDGCAYAVHRDAVISMFNLDDSHIVTKMLCDVAIFCSGWQVVPLQDESLQKSVRLHIKDKQPRVLADGEHADDATSFAFRSYE